MKRNKGRQKSNTSWWLLNFLRTQKKKSSEFCRYSDEQNNLPVSRPMIQMRKWSNLRGFPPVIIFHHLV
jgi:hypothetical protein